MATDLISEAQRAIEGVIEGRGTLHEARNAFAAAREAQASGIYSWDSIEDSSEQAVYDAVEAFKMALDALEADQDALARSYMKVARIKLAKARGEPAGS